MPKTPEQKQQDVDRLIHAIETAIRAELRFEPGYALAAVAKTNWNEFVRDVVEEKLTLRKSHKRSQ